MNQVVMPWAVQVAGHLDAIMEHALCCRWVLKMNLEDPFINRGFTAIPSLKKQKCHASIRTRGANKSFIAAQECKKLQTT